MHNTQTLQWVIVNNPLVIVNNPWVIVNNPLQLSKYINEAAKSKLIECNKEYNSQ